MPIISPKIPSGLEELMRGLAKSVIKENPQNIYEFAAEYFENLLKERDGSCDQSYKKFATYKVYKKNKSARLKREKENSNDVSDVRVDNGFRKDGVAVNYGNQNDFEKKDSSEEKSIEEIILPTTSQSLHSLPKAQTSISSESEINATIKKEASVDVDGAPSQSGNSEEDDIKNMVLDEDMEQAALKIQSSFRGHKVRKEMKERVSADDSVSESIPEKKTSELEVESNQLEEIAPEADGDIEKCENDESDVVKGSLDENNEKETEQAIDSNDIKETLECDVDDDIANMVLDDDMEQAALKIQSSFRGHKVRRDMNAKPIEEKIENEVEAVLAVDEDAVEQPDDSEVVEESDEPEKLQPVIMQLDDGAENDEKVSEEQSLKDDETVEGIVEGEIEAQEEIKEENIVCENVSKDVEAVDEMVEIESRMDENIPDGAEVLAEAPIDELITEELSNNLNVETEIVDDSACEEILKVADGIFETVDESLIELVEVTAGEVNEAEDNLSIGEKIEETSLPSNEVGEIQEKEELGEQELLETEEDSNGVAVMRQDSENFEAGEETEPKNAELSPQGIEEAAATDISDAVKLENEQNVLDELTEGTVADENSENPIIPEDIIESTDNVDTANNDDDVEVVVIENEPQENEPIVNVDEEKTVEVNEQEPQEGLNELPNKSESGNLDFVEATEEELEENIDGIPVIEELCEKKSIEDLESDQLNAESEIDENALRESSLHEIENHQANLEDIQADNLEKLPSGDIEYSSLKESMSEAADSVDEADNKSRDITDEKSIDGDTTGSKQNSFDEIQEEVNEQSPPEEKQSESFIHSSTVDDMEMSVTQQAAKEVEEQLLEATNAVESILENEISPIELMDEVVNEYAGTVANELFNGNVEQAEEEIGSIKFSEDENEEKPTKESIEPRLSVENPLQEIEKPKSIDLTQENVQVSQDELEPIIDEILQPEKEESEIPEESQAPMDENVPTVSMEEKAPTVEKDEQLPHDETEEESDPQPPKVEDDVSDMILDEEMEDAALKIQAAFRGHQVRKEQVIEQKSESQVKSEENVEEKSKTTDTNVVIDQCSEEIEDAQEQEETEQQDTSADVEEIQESESVDQEETQEESHEEDENVEEETAVESVENDTAEQAEDDPNGTPEEEAEASEQPQNNDDDDVANMVLDEEMEQAALKIQSTFRGHKTRKDIKKDESQGEASASDEPQEQKDSVQDVDDEIANMVLDDEMEQAALKIQSTFRGHKTRKDTKKDENADDSEKNEEEKPEEKKDEEPPKEEEAPASSSTETDKSAKQLQEEEDIANLVMDAEMEQTALKIQSAFRGKSRKKPAKDGDESMTSSGNEQTDDDEEDEDPIKSDEDPFHQNEMSQEQTGEKSYDEEKGSDYSTAHYSPSEDAQYSIERHDTSYEHEQIALNSSTDDLNLMQGGGIFPEPSGESSDMLTGSSGDDREPDRHSSYEKVASDNSHEIDEPISKQKSVDPLNDEQVIENFDFVANKDTAEAMYYSLKKNELETQKQLTTEKQLSLKKQPTEEEEAMSMETMTNLENESIEDEDDDDVVIGPIQPSSAKRLKYGMSMDDRLLGSILSQDYSTKARKEGYPDDGFDPLLEATMRNHHFLEKLHEISNSDEDKNVSYNDYPGDDEDQFDDFYNSNNIRQKMMASSISIADSDYFEPAGNKSIIDDDKIRTALETIHSSDSESTIASAATKIQADRMNARRNNNITSHSMQYSSIGNAAIDRSLDEFIQSQELRIEQFDEELEGYYSPPPRKQESEEWTDDTTTYTDSDKKVGTGGIIDIKLEQKSFLTVDDRRRTLHREDAIQRNSTREDEDSSKSSNVSGEKLLDKEAAPFETTAVAAIAAQDSVIDTEINVPILDLTAKSKSSSQSQAKPQRMKRQHTMPVQIQTDVIRVVPKHLRKRIKSADGDKKKRVSK